MRLKARFRTRALERGKQPLTPANLRNYSRYCLPRIAMQVEARPTPEIIYQLFVEKAG